MVARYSRDGNYPGWGGGCQCHIAVGEQKSYNAEVVEKPRGVRRETYELNSDTTFLSGSVNSGAARGHSLILSKESCTARLKSRPFKTGSG